MDYIKIIETVAILVLGCVSYYLKSKNVISTNIVSLITDAEKEYENVSKSGKLKMAYCVTTLYEKYVPVILKKIFTKEMLEQMVQNVFDTIENYIGVAVNTMADKITGKDE